MAKNTSDRGDAAMLSNMSDIGLHPNLMSPGGLPISSDKPEVCMYDVVRKDNGFYVQYPYAGEITDANSFKQEQMGNGSCLHLKFSLSVSTANNLTVIGDQSPAISNTKYIITAK